MQKKIFYKILIFYTIFFFQQNSFALIFEGIPRVIDGDSLEINNNKIRLFGIDAPEKKQIRNLARNFSKSRRVEKKKLITIYC